MLTVSHFIKFYLKLKNFTTHLLSSVIFCSSLINLVYLPSHGHLITEQQWGSEKQTFELQIYLNSKL